MQIITKNKSMDIKDLKTFRDRIMVLPFEEDTSMFGIVLSEDNLSDTRKGEIVAMASNVKVENPEINIGDTLYYTKNASTVLIENVEYHIVQTPSQTYFVETKKQ